MRLSNTFERFDRFTVAKKILDDEVLKVERGIISGMTRPFFGEPWAKIVQRNMLAPIEGTVRRGILVRLTGIGR